MPDERLEIYAENFVLGTMSQTESEAFAKRLANGEAEALAAFEQARRVVLALPYALPQRTPPAELKQNILQAVAAERNRATTNHEAPQPPPATIRTMPQRTFWQRTQRSLAWAAVFLMFAFGYGYWNANKVLAELVRERVRLQEQLQTRETEINDLKFKLAFHVQVEKVLQKTQRLVIALNDTRAGQNAAATAIVDREQALGYFIADRLGALEENRDYQLWYIGAAGPVDAGVFEVDENGHGVSDIRNLPKNLSEISAFAVTIEPKGGSPKPTLDQMVLLGKTG